MRLFEIEEAMEIIKHINGMLLMFSATPKTNKLLIEYLNGLILELQDQDMLDEAQEQSGEEINLDNQVSFLKCLLDIVEERDQPKLVVDKNSN